MLNSKGERELAYIVTIDEIRPIEGYDRVEYARVGGWWVIVSKNQFKVGEPAIYFEIDSKVPAIEPFEFLAKRDYKIKTLKMCKVVSQGLLMHPYDFHWSISYTQCYGSACVIHAGSDDLTVGDFVTERLGVTYADPVDNVRKAPTKDKYASMKDRHKKFFRTRFGKFLFKHEVTRDFIYLFLGKKKTSQWPQWVVKTDEERVQNLPCLFPPNPDELWYATEKIDGTSTTFTYRKGKFYVCSRNVVFDKPNKKCFYDSNVYLEMAEKYDIENKIKKIFNTFNKDYNGQIDFVTIQGETYGGTIQKRNYGTNDHRLAVFNLIIGYKDGHTRRFNPVEMRNILSHYNIPTVPILGSCVLPDTCQAVLDYAASEPSEIDGGMREGIVFRSSDGSRSFKAVSNDFLLKYHQ